MKNKRKILIIIVVLLIIARLLLLLLSPLIYIVIDHMRSPQIPSNVKQMVLDNEDDYDCVAMVYYNDYLKCGPEDGRNDVAYSALCNDRVSRSSEPEYEIILSDEELTSFQNVYNSYRIDDQPWERVYVYDGYVVFSNINGRMSIVYSVNDEKPKYVNAPIKDHRHKIVVSGKITDHWYYVRGYDF